MTASSPLFDASQPTLSHHLCMLREAQFADSERRRLWACHHVRSNASRELSAWQS